MIGQAWVNVVVCGTVAMSVVTTAFAEDRGHRLPPHPLGSLVVLADGGIVAGRLEAITPETVIVESSLLGRLDLPRATVAGYRASMAFGPIPPRRPDRRGGEAAIVRLVNGDEVIATALTVTASEATIHMEAALAQDVVIPLEAVRAIDLSPTPVEVTLPRRFVALADGSRFVEASLPRVGDPAEFVATLVEGDGTRLLSTLDPLAYEQAVAVPLARGSTLSGDWPSARGATAFTGLGLHAPARVRYRLATPVGRFETRVAIDDSAGQGGSVIVRVRAIDAEGVEHDRYASPILWGGDEPHSISVGLDGAVELELIVEPADGNTILDRTIWLDPRVVSDPPRS